METGKFLQYTWDLASYPANYMGSLDFHLDFIEAIKPYAVKDKMNQLNYVAARSPTASDLYGNL
jgi:hypothetical protein